MSFSGYDLHNHRGLELSDHNSEINNKHYFYDPEGMKRDYEEPEHPKRPEQPPFPWRRYFARSIDVSIYSLLFDGIAAIFFKINISDYPFYLSILSTIIGIIIMLILEPIFLSKWGTTPGKWIWGITVTDRYGNFLDQKTARQRTWEVIQYGYGFHIPLYNIYRMWKSYKECKKEELLDWELESIIILNDKKGWRIGAFFAAQLVLSGVTALFLALSTLPMNHGDLTVKEFSENYNHYAKYYGLDYDETKLAEDGTWVEDDDPYSVNIVFGGVKPKFQYIVEDGIIKGITFEMNETDGELYEIPTEEVYLAAVSLMRAQKGFLPFADKTDNLFNILKVNGSKGISDFSAYGVKLDLEVNTQGYIVSDNMCWPEEESKDHSLAIQFKMTIE